MLPKQLHSALQNSSLQTPSLVSLQARMRLIYASRFTVGLLAVLGVVRAFILVIAYPPAHGADSSDYFLYAAQFEGLDAPVVFQLIYPFYPLFIYLTHYVLGNVYLLIFFQMALSASQGILYYVGLRSYSPALAFAVALVVIGDAQTGVLYNLTSTEPFYMFLLGLSFALFAIQIKKPSNRRMRGGDIALGVALALVLLTRPVGRYLIVPFGALFLLGTRSIWRSAVFAASYGAILVASMAFNQFVFDQLELTGGGGFMLNRPLRVSGLFEADNGPVSSQIFDMLEQCQDGESSRECLIRQTGDWPSVRRLYAEAYQEMLQEHSREFAELVIEDFTDFLRLPGLQYSGPITPSDAQCQDVETAASRDTLAYLEKDYILYGAESVTYESFYPIIYDIRTAMCPPWPDNDEVREIVDEAALRYRSLSRPHPYLWYGALGFIVLLIPWARQRFLIIVLLAGAILGNHAAISAAVLNVQPRYIAVVNPFKAILLLTLLFIIGVFVVRLFDAWLVTRHSSEHVQ